MSVSKRWGTGYRSFSVSKRSAATATHHTITPSHITPHQALLLTLSITHTHTLTFNMLQRDVCVLRVCDWALEGVQVSRSHRVPEEKPELIKHINVLRVEVMISWLQYFCHFSRCVLISSWCADVFGSLFSFSSSWELQTNEILLVQLLPPNKIKNVD